MSNAIFPTLPGLSWNVIKTPTWSTKVQRAVSGRELRAAFYQSPIWRFNLSYEFLRADIANSELQTIMAFYNNRQGSFDSFLYQDSSDYAVTAMTIGVGDGVKKDFALLHSIGGWVEPVGYTNTASIYVNGVYQSSGVLTNPTNNGIIFITAPTAGAVISWTGQFYYRVRFDKDSYDFDNFMKDLWTLKKLDFVTAR